MSRWKWAVVCLTLPGCLRLVDFEYDPPCEEKWDLQSDRSHCGTCDTECSSATDCKNGVCVCPAQSPDACGQECTNRAIDVFNCGSCGNVCQNGYCQAGQCVCTGTVCDTACVDTKTDAFHCGSCGAPCPEIGFQRCSGGLCWAPCRGTPLPCEAHSASACPASAGCEVQTGCYGGTFSCGTFDHACSFCDETVGCNCDGAGLCQGVAKCEDQSSLACNENAGCSFGDRCVGLGVTMCEVLSATECELVDGCSLAPSPP